MIGRHERRDWPELTEWPELMPKEVSGDFVERTWRLVLEDQRRIAEEAAQVEDIQIPPELLEAYAPPEPSPDFAHRLVARMKRGEQIALAGYPVPEPSPDFVERTLAALQVPALRQRQRALLRRTAPWVALAAMLLASVLLLPTTRDEISPAASAYSPSPWATAMAEQMRHRDLGHLDLGAADPLILLASGALTEEEE